MFFLQNAQCTCTEENIEFVKNILLSEKYKYSEKIIVVGSGHHHAVETLSSHGKITVNTDRKLEMNGLKFYKDKLFEFKDGKIIYWSDLYDDTLLDLKNKYLY